MKVPNGNPIPSWRLPQDGQGRCVRMPPQGSLRVRHPCPPDGRRDIYAIPKARRSEGPKRRVEEAPAGPGDRQKGID